MIGKTMKRNTRILGLLHNRIPKLSLSRLAVVLALLLLIYGIVFLVQPLHSSRKSGSIHELGQLYSNNDKCVNCMEETCLKYRKALNVAFYFDILPVDVGGGVMEFEWITNILLGKIDRPLRIISGDDFKRFPRNDTLHVYLFNPKKNLFADLKSPGLVNQGAYHMGDEIMKNDISYYSDASYVFRNYYNSEYLLKPNVHFAPLGMKSGFGAIPPSQVLPASCRRYLANFIGSLRSNRKEMISQIKNHGIPAFLSYEHAWASKEGIHVITYRNILRESVFTLAPWGNNPESLRLYEALEAGSIPIFQRCDGNRSPLTPMGSEVPIPQFDTWEEATLFIRKMQSDMQSLNSLQAKLISFWKTYKDTVQLKFKSVIDESFRKAHGYEC